VRAAKKKRPEQRRKEEAAAAAAKADAAAAKKKRKRLAAAAAASDAAAAKAKRAKLSSSGDTSNGGAAGDGQFNGDEFDEDEDGGEGEFSYGDRSSRGIRASTRGIDASDPRYEHVLAIEKEDAEIAWFEKALGLDNASGKTKMKKQLEEDGLDVRSATVCRATGFFLSCCALNRVHKSHFT
jgi:hypothetical protein